MTGEASGKRIRDIRLSGAWMPRTAIAVGVGTTIAMNVYGGLWDGGTGGAVVAALYPVALVVSLETLIWMVRRGKGWIPVADHWEQWCAVLALAGLAVITGIISYLHALTVLQRTGSYAVVAHLGPLVPDQLILTGTLALMAAARLTAGQAKTTATTTTVKEPAKATRQARPPKARRSGPGRPEIEVVLPDGALAAAVAANVPARRFKPWVFENYQVTVDISRYKANELLKGARTNGHNHGEA